MSILKLYFKSNLLIRILVALILGAIFGLILQNSPKIIAFLTPFGELFVRLLKMIVVPVIASTLIVGAGSIEPSQLGRIGLMNIVVDIAGVLTVAKSEQTLDENAWNS